MIELFLLSSVRPPSLLFPALFFATLSRNEAKKHSLLSLPLSLSPRSCVHAIARNSSVETKPLLLLLLSSLECSCRNVVVAVANVAAAAVFVAVAAVVVVVVPGAAGEVLIGPPFFAHRRRV